MLLNTYLDTGLILKNAEDLETSTRKVPCISYDFTYLKIGSIQNGIAKVSHHQCEGNTPVKAGDNVSTGIQAGGRGSWIILYLWHSLFHNHKYCFAISAQNVSVLSCFEAATILDKNYCVM